MNFISVVNFMVNSAQFLVNFGKYFLEALQTKQQTRNIKSKSSKVRNYLDFFQFWAAYYGCSSQYKDSVQVFLEQIDLIRRMVAAHPDHLVLATTAVEVEARFCNHAVV